MNFLWLFPFLFSIFIFFTIPGFILLDRSNTKIPFWPKIFGGSAVGYVVFTLTSYLFLVLQLDFLIIPTFILVDLYFFRSFLRNLPKKIIPQKNLAIFVFIFLIGIIGQLLIIAPSGWNANGDLLFWSSHAHDGSWHIALMNEVKKGFPFQNPVFAGEKLVNYHIFSDIAPAIFNKYLGFSSLELYFRLFPLLYSLLLGALAFILGKSLGKTNASGFWSAIFIYFGGSFGYIVRLIQGKTIGGESIFWTNQTQSSIGNPPQIVSHIIVLTFLYLFIYLLENKSKILYLISVLLLGSLIVFKVYASIVLLGALFATGAWQIVKDRKFMIISLAILASVLSLVLYLPFYAKTSSFLIFQPWFFIRSMVVADSRLNWLDLELRRQFFLSLKTWKGYLRVFQIELIGFSIFFIGNLGMRFIGLFDFWNFLKTFFKNYFNQLFVLIIVLSLILPLLFLQKGVAGGTGQFLQYFILLFGVLAAISISRFMDKLHNIFLKFSLSALIIILAVPTQIGLLREFYGRSPFTKISKEELSALNFLKKNSPKESVILTPLYDPNLDLKDKIPNIWDWFDTAYVSAFSERRTYFNDYEQVDIMGYDYKERLEIKKEIFTETDPEIVKQKLLSSGVDYLYFLKPITPKVDLNKINLTKVFENNLVEIWSRPF